MRDEIQERIERMHQTKRNDIKWLNSLNNATMIIAAQIPKGFKNYSAVETTIRELADWYYEQLPLKRILPKKGKKPVKKISKQNLKKLLKKAKSKVRKGGKI